MSTRSEDECLKCSHMRSEHFDEPVSPDQEPVPHCEACYILSINGHALEDCHGFIEDVLEVEKRWALALGDLDDCPHDAWTQGSSYRTCADCGESLPLLLVPPRDSDDSTGRRLKTWIDDKTYEIQPGSQVGGDHYSKRAIQPIEYIMANGLDFCEGNVIKLVTRWRDKGGIEDLEKIIQYAQFLIEDAKANPGKYELES